MRTPQEGSGPTPHEHWLKGPLGVMQCAQAQRGVSLGTCACGRVLTANTHTAHSDQGLKDQRL